MHGAGIIVAGDAGIGKTRFIKEYRERYGAQSLIATGVCREFGQRAFEPLAEILDQLARGASVSPLPLRARSKDEHLATIVAAVERATTRRMTTIVVEDIHWAQVELLQTLAALVQWAAHQRLLLIMTCRQAEIPPSSPRFKALARLSRETSTLRLEPFAPAELSELMRDALTDFGASVPVETFNDVRRRAGGNPFFAEELLRHAVDEQRRGRSGAHAALPLSLQGVIRERLDRCREHERAFLSAASVLGQRFRLDVLTDVFGIDRDTALTSLATLMDLQLIDRTDDPHTYEFHHALARDVVYDDLVPAQAVALHRRIAETVEALPAAVDHAELLAHSFWRAGMPERAAPYCEAAGDRAMEHYAYEDAVTWFERAAAAFGDRAADLGRVLGKSSIALNRLGEPKRAVPLYERAIAALAAGGDFDGAVHMSTFLAGTLYNDARSADARAAYERAAALAARSGAPELERHVALRRFTFSVVSREVEHASKLAATIDESTLDPASRDTFEYFLSTTTLHALRDDRERRQASIARAFAALDHRAAPPYERRFAHGYVVVDALAVGDVEEARRHAELGLEVASGMRSDVAYMLALLADAEERAGDLRRAHEHLSAIVPSPDFLHRHARAIAAVRIALALGDDTLLADAYDAALLREAERGGNADAALELAGAFAVAAARLNRQAESAALAERFARRIATPYGLAWQIGEIAVLFPALAARLREVVIAGGIDPPSRLNAALCAFLDAIVAGENGDVAASTASGRRAAAMFDALGLPIARARALELAREPAAARDVYRERGWAVDVRRLERTAMAGGAGSLSARERDVARLVAAGKNNREAARDLAITHKAVEKYLTVIYRKLGLASRSQLAAYVAANGIEIFPPAEPS